jgi:hypothetical protein
MAKDIIYVSILLLISLICSGHSFDEVASSRPPMGWSSRSLGCAINDTLI